MKKRRLILFLILLILVLIVHYTVDFSALAKRITVANTSQERIEGFIDDSGTLSLFFCPREACEEELVAFLMSANDSIHCAFYDVGLVSVQNVLLEKSTQMDVRVVTDDDYLKKFNYSFVKADRSGLMHDKFCIVDGTRFSSGSMNPTQNDAHKNNNNLLFISSPTLAANYEAEFAEMWQGTFKKGEKVRVPKAIVGKVAVQNYFCPEDDCALHVKEELEKAKKSIHFMTFSFTHEDIVDTILLKKLDGIEIRGIMEKTQLSEYSKYDQLKYQGVDVLIDGNKNNMHHKVFIIDSKVVVTGSMNPTAGGDGRNDENVLIFDDALIAERFEEEFRLVYRNASLSSDVD